MPSAYIQFCKLARVAAAEYLKTVEKATERLSIIAALWRDMSYDDKEDLKAKAKADKFPDSVTVSKAEWDAAVKSAAARAKSPEAAAAKKKRQEAAARKKEKKAAEKKPKRAARPYDIFTKMFAEESKTHGGEDFHGMARIAVAQFLWKHHADKDDFKETQKASFTDEQWVAAIAAGAERKASPNAKGAKLTAAQKKKAAETRAKKKAAAKKAADKKAAKKPKKAAKKPKKKPVEEDPPSGDDSDEDW